MLRFVLGTLFGGTMGVFAMCLCFASSKAEQELLPFYEDKDNFRDF